MKKLSLLLMLIGGLSLSAQVPVVPRDTNLFYYWWYEDLIADTAQMILPTLLSNVSTGDSGRWTDPLEQPFTICGDVAKYFYTDTALSVLGIRLCSYHYKYNWSPTREMLDTTFCPNAFLSLYKREGDSMLLLGRKHILYDDPCTPSGSMYTTIRSKYSDCVTTFMYDYDMAFREYYFDQPITVEDSFYVAVTIHPDTTRPIDVTSYMAYDYNYYYCISQSDINFHCTHRSYNFPALKYRYRLLTQNNSPGDSYQYIGTLHEWRDTAIKSYLMVFPIVKYGSVFANCTPVEGLRTIKQEGATFYFEWSDSTMSHRGWEFTYVPEGSSPDGGTAVECSEANASATVEPGIQYRAFVRPRCVANRYGDWGTGVPFCYNCQPGAINAVEASVSVHPNPTSSVVEVVSANNIQRIEVYDTRGTMVSTATGNGGNTRIDLSPYADGLYLIKILTPEGTATKQVMKTSNSDPKER